MKKCFNFVLMIYCSQNFYNFLTTIKSSYPIKNGVVDYISRVIPRLSIIDKSMCDDTEIEDVMYFDLSKDLGYCLFKQFKKTTTSDIESCSKNKLSKSRVVHFINKLSPGYNDRSNFSEHFSNAWKLYQVLSTCTFDVVCGEDIKKYYKTDNYSNVFGAGSLYGSCMNDNTHYLDIYEKNPETISLLILKNGNSDKIVGRALLWKTDKGLYMDRVYYSADFIQDIFVLWGRSNHVKFDHSNKISRKPSRLVAKLKPSKYKYYPYLDSMEYYYPKTGIIMSVPDYDIYISGFFRNILSKFRDIKKGKMIRLRSTTGSTSSLRY